MEKQEMLEFGRWVRDQREQRGLTQRELAAKIDVSPGGLGAIESGSAKAIGGKMVRKLKRYFETGETRQPAVAALKQMNCTGLEHMLPALRRLGCIAMASDFRKRAVAAAEAIGCSAEEAAATIFRHELQRMDHQ